MTTSTTAAPSFEIRRRDAEELGDMFLEVAARLLASTGGPSHGRRVEDAIRLATLFVEAVAELQNQK